MVKQIDQLQVGDPLDPNVDVGPVIDHGALERIDAWVREAVDGGAELLTGGRREDPLYWPTVLSNTKPDMKVRCMEVFGPVVTLERYETFEEALALVNDSEYGLQAGVFIDRSSARWRLIGIWRSAA